MNYILIVETPGIAFYTGVVPDAGNAIGDAVSNGWPALLFVIISAMIAGMIYWISVSVTYCFTHFLMYILAGFFYHLKHQAYRTRHYILGLGTSVN